MSDLTGGSAERFVDAARIAHGEGRPLVIEAAAVLQIAADPAGTIRFRRLVREMNDPELRDLIVTYLGTLQRDENRRARAADLWGDNIKLGVGSIGLGTVVTGMVAVAATAGATGGLALIACGFGGAVIALGGHTFFKSKSNRARDAVEDIAVLIDALRS